MRTLAALALLLVPACAPGVGESPTLTAVATAELQWSCPAARIAYVQVAPLPGAAPPSDVAADPARLELWQRSHPEGTAMQFVTGGCGKVGNLRCNYGGYYVDDHGQAVDGWTCAAFDLVPEGLRPQENTDRTRYPRALAALAAQLDARNDPVTARAVREMSARIETAP